MYCALRLQVKERDSRYGGQMATGTDNEVLMTILTYDVTETGN
jgi:hypothetical protein